VDAAPYLIDKLVRICSLVWGLRGVTPDPSPIITVCFFFKDNSVMMGTALVSRATTTGLGVREI